MNPETYVKDDAIVGKTIAKVVETCDTVLISFTDGTCTKFEVDRGYDRGEEAVVFGEPDHYDLLRLGIISASDYEAVAAEQRRKDEELQKSYRRQQYENLKKEFEK